MSLYSREISGFRNTSKFRSKGESAELSLEIVILFICIDKNKGDICKTRLVHGFHS